MEENIKELLKLLRNNLKYIAGVVITGYATMKRDRAFYEKQKIKFNYCVLDEAQFIKNHATKNAQIVKKINADYRLAVAKRLDWLVNNKKLNTPSKMVVWKCGSSCAATGGQAAAIKWISDVNLYFEKLNK